MDNLFTELKRRNVFKVAVAYLVVSWLTVQVAETLTPRMAMPDWVPGFIIILLIVSFPIALLFAWAYELTPDGIKKSKDVEADSSITYHTNRKIDFIIIGALTLIIGGLVFERTSNNVIAIPETEITVAQPSIAVLAFEDFSPGKDQEYFADGISDEILNLLAKTRTMKVAGRTSSFSFKGKDDDIPTIASKLNVGHILEGSINKSGNRLKITAQLINAEGNHIWSETYKRDLTDIFEIQEEIAAAIMQELKLKLLGEAVSQLKTRKVNVELYNQYLLARELVRKYNRPSIKRAREILTEITQKDPTFGEAQAALSQALLYSSKWGYGDMAYYEATRLAETPMKLALEFAPDSADVQAINCHFMRYTNKLQSAEQACNKALSINPNHTDALRRQAGILAAQMRFDDALKTLLKTVESDPISYAVNAQLATAYIDRGDMVKAEQYIARLEDISPESDDLIRLKISILRNTSKPAEALHYGMQSIAKLKIPSGTTHEMGWLAMLMGLDEMAKPLFHPPGEVSFDLKSGAIDKALERIEGHLKVDPENGMGQALLPLLQWMNGDRANALDGFLENIEDNGTKISYNPECSPSIQIAQLYKQLGHMDQATAWVDPCRIRAKAQSDAGIYPEKTAILQHYLYFFDDEYNKAFDVITPHIGMIGASFFTMIDPHLYPIKDMEGFQHLMKIHARFWAEQREIYLKLQAEEEVKR